MTRARVRKRRDLIFRENEDGFWVDLTQALTEKLSLAHGLINNDEVKKSYF